MVCRILSRASAGVDYLPRVPLIVWQWLLRVPMIQAIVIICRGRRRWCLKTKGKHRRSWGRTRWRMLHDRRMTSSVTSYIGCTPCTGHGRAAMLMTLRHCQRSPLLTRTLLRKFRFVLVALTTATFSNTSGFSITGLFFPHITQVMPGPLQVCRFQVWSVM